MKNLIRTMISGIAYLRELFPEDFFRDEVIGGLHVKLLLAKDAASRRLNTWVEEGIFDAFDRGYLSEAVLGIYLDEGAPERLAESYNFRVRYNELVVSGASGGETTGQPSVLHPSKEDVHRAVTEVLRKQVVRSSVMRTLPAEKFLTVKLIYTEDTPERYRPKAADFHETAERLTFDDTPEAFLLGKVATRFHALDVASFTATQTSQKSEELESKARQSETSDAMECTPTASDSLSPPSSSEEDRKRSLLKKTKTAWSKTARTSKKTKANAILAGSMKTKIRSFK